LLLCLHWRCTFGDEAGRDVAQSHALWPGGDACRLFEYFADRRSEEIAAEL